MRTWIVTGGAGFIGSNFVRLALAETDARIVVARRAHLRRQPREPARRSRSTRASRSCARRHRRARRGRDARPRASARRRVLNFAAETHVDRSIDGPRGVRRARTWSGRFELLEASRGLRAELSAAERAAFRFLHVSTDEVYGSLGAEGAFHETTPYAPHSPYSASKAGADHSSRAGTTPTACRRSSRTARTTTARTSSPRS